jgi:putative PIN family toxin of toxin-antitoxin system
MKRVVIDTNVLLVAFGRQSRYRWIADLLANERFTLLVSTEIMLEYEEVFLRRQPAFQALAALIFLKEAPMTQLVEVWFRWDLIHADPDDNKFVDCAIAGGADAIVTEDAHFSVLKNLPFPQMNVLSVQEFAAYLDV